jgi:hypothetical protein
MRGLWPMGPKVNSPGPLSVAADPFEGYCDE